MPVTDEEGRVVGVITELDLLEAVADGRDLIKTTAEEIMNREVMTANVETPVDDLIKIMTDQHVIRVPITDTAQGRLVAWWRAATCSAPCSNRSSSPIRSRCSATGLGAPGSACRRCSTICRRRGNTPLGPADSRGRPLAR